MKLLISPGDRTEDGAETEPPPCDPFRFWCFSSCVLIAPPTSADLSPAFGSRLASSLGDLYAADAEEDEKTRISSVSVSHSPSHMAPPPLSNYGSGPRGMQHEVNNNGPLYGGPVTPPAGTGYARPQHQDGHGAYSAMKGPSGRYLSRSIPVSPLTQQQQLSPAPGFWLVLSVLASETDRIQREDASVRFWTPLCLTEHFSFLMRRFLFDSQILLEMHQKWEATNLSSTGSDLSLRPSELGTSSISVTFTVDIYREKFPIIIRIKTNKEAV